MTELNLKALCDTVRTLETAMMQTWRQLSDRDCGTCNKAGVDAVGRDVAGFLEELGFRVRFHEYEKAGNLLIAERGDTTKPFIALVGHLDTVFADGTAAERPFTVTGNRVTGPGVLDMKGGVTVMLYALKVLTEAGWDAPVKVILAGDEEVAHADTTAGADMALEARGARYGLNFETGFEDNSVVISRKGVGTFRFDVQGIGAHAGNDPKGGRSAVNEIARKVADIVALTDWEKETTINVGVLQGGTVPNACAEHAHCVVDVRFYDPEDFKRVEAGFEAIAAKVYTEGTHTTVKKLSVCPSMVKLEGSAALFERANAIAQANGLPAMTAKGVGGGSDSAVLAMEGIPVLCAMGVKGGCNHTVREFALKSSITERACLALTLIATL